MKKIAKEITEWRVNKGISQEELARKTGITQAAISYWENNKRTPKITECIILADFYGISIDELVGHEIKRNW